MPHLIMPRSKKFQRATSLIGLLVLAFVTLGSGTCVVIEEGPYGVYEDPGINEDRMEEQEIEVMDEEDR